MRTVIECNGTGKSVLSGATSDACRFSMYQVIDSYVDRVREIGVRSLMDIWSRSSEVLNVAILHTVHLVMIFLREHSCFTRNWRRQMSKEENEVEWSFFAVVHLYANDVSFSLNASRFH